MKKRGNALAVLAIIGAGFLSGCTQFETQYQYAGPLPRPDVVLVYNFATSASDVKLDSSLLGNVSGRMDEIPQTNEEIRLGQNVADVIAVKLVEEIRSMGLPVERGIGSLSKSPRVLMIEGNILSINQGDRTERVVIGLGAGRTAVKIHTEVFERTPRGRRLVSEFAIDAMGSRKPGMAETMGVGAAAGNLAVSAAASGAGALGSEALGETVEADAKRAAARIAVQLGAYFAQQGWIPPTAVPQSLVP